MFEHSGGGRRVCLPVFSAYENITSCPEVIHRLSTACQQVIHSRIKVIHSLSTACPQSYQQVIHKEKPYNLAGYRAFQSITSASHRMITRSRSSWTQCARALTACCIGPRFWLDCGGLRPMTSTQYTRISQAASP